MLKYYKGKKINDFSQGVFAVKMELEPSKENSVGVGEIFGLSLKSPTVIIFAAVAITWGFGAVALALLV